MFKFLSIICVIACLLTAISTVRGSLRGAEASKDRLSTILENAILHAKNSHPVHVGNAPLEYVTLKFFNAAGGDTSANCPTPVVTAYSLLTGHCLRSYDKSTSTTTYVYVKTTSTEATITGYPTMTCEGPNDFAASFTLGSCSQGNVIVTKPKPYINYGELSGKRLDGYNSKTSCHSKNSFDLIGGILETTDKNGCRNYDKINKVGTSYQYVSSPNGLTVNYFSGSSTCEGTASNSTVITSTEYCHELKYLGIVYAHPYFSFNDGSKSIAVQASPPTKSPVNQSPVKSPSYNPPKADDDDSNSSDDDSSGDDGSDGSDGGY